MLGEGPKPQAHVTRRGPVEVDALARAVSIHGTVTERLTPMEFKLLTYLMERSPAVAPWDDIERNIWGVRPEFLTHSYAFETLEFHCRRLRMKLKGAAPCLVTHKGIGLQFDPAKA